MTMRVSSTPCSTARPCRTRDRSRPRMIATGTGSFSSRAMLRNSPPDHLHAACVTGSKSMSHTFEVDHAKQRQRRIVRADDGRITEDFVPFGDADALARALREAVEGEVRFDRGSRA